MTNIIYVYVGYFLTRLYFKGSKRKAIFIFIALFIVRFIPVFLFGGYERLLDSGGVFRISGMESATTVLQSEIFGGLFYFAIDWYNKKQRQKELEKQNLQSELKLLKNQINPHFLFNTLNNIDSLIKSDTDKASAALLAMSDMMRYMIYDTNTEKVPLVQELAYIENYLNLQAMQFANTELVKYSVEGNSGDIAVAPMLFIPFIENAFKHCSGKTVRHAICIMFAMDGATIRFRAENIVNPETPITKDATGGIGLDTVKRRLEILYPDKYALQINEKNDCFSVFLTIDTR
ncbi:MAG: histidine kinase [Tannerella sp.]|nr:histidine kinase [Tannerella sp.]